MNILSTFSFHIPCCIHITVVPYGKFFTLFTNKILKRDLHIDPYTLIHVNRIQFKQFLHKSSYICCVQAKRERCSIMSLSLLVVDFTSTWVDMDLWSELQSCFFFFTFGSQAKQSASLDSPDS